MTTLLIVVALTILEIAQLIMCTMYTWTYLITIWGNFSGFVVIPQEAPVLVILCGFCEFLRFIVVKTLRLGLQRP
jgi:hypothetical protein